MNTTDREKLLERIDHTIYQLQYPPLNGGPDQDDIISGVALPCGVFPGVVPRSQP